MANDNLNIPSTGNPELTNMVKILTEFPVLSILLLLEMPLNNLSSTLTFVLNRSFAHLLEFCKFYGSSYCKLGDAWHPPTLLYSNTWESSFTSSFCLLSVPFTTSLSQLCLANQQRSILCHLHTPQTLSVCILRQKTLKSQKEITKIIVQNSTFSFFLILFWFITHQTQSNV